MQNFGLFSSPDGFTWCFGKFDPKQTRGFSNPVKSIAACSKNSSDVFVLTLGEGMNSLRGNRTWVRRFLGWTKSG
jgi:hypothetical protein